METASPSYEPVYDCEHNLIFFLSLDIFLVLYDENVPEGGNFDWNLSGCSAIKKVKLRRTGMEIWKYLSRQFCAEIGQCLFQ